MFMVETYGYDYPRTTLRVLLGRPFKNYKKFLNESSHLQDQLMSRCLGDVASIEFVGDSLLSRRRGVDGIHRLFRRHFQKDSQNMVSYTINGCAAPRALLVSTDLWIGGRGLLGQV